MKCILCMVSCCLKCMERFIKFLNKNAYIQCAITSNNFCVSAKDAFFLILRNAFIFALAAGLGKMFMTMGTLFICVGTSLTMYHLLNEEYKDADGNVVGLNNIWFVFVVMVFLSYLIGKMFMEVWGMAADTILQCYCLDADISGGDGASAFSKYTPNRLQGFITDLSNSDDAKAKLAKYQENEAARG